MFEGINKTPVQVLINSAVHIYGFYHPLLCAGKIPACLFNGAIYTAPDTGKDRGTGAGALLLFGDNDRDPGNICHDPGPDQALRAPPDHDGFFYFEPETAKHFKMSPVRVRDTLENRPYKKNKS